MCARKIDFCGSASKNYQDVDDARPQVLGQLPSQKLFDIDKLGFQVCSLSGSTSVWTWRQSHSKRDTGCKIEADKTVTEAAVAHSPLAKRYWLTEQVRTLKECDLQGSGFSCCVSFSFSFCFLYLGTQNLKLNKLKKNIFGLFYIQTGQKVTRRSVGRDTNQPKFSIL